MQQDIAFKKYANRWICAALGRPIRGWPKLSTLGYFERAVVEVLLESYPGNTHRDIRREDTWDSLGVWLLGSCPPPHLLYSLIETAAETKPLWRAFLNGCSSREVSQSFRYASLTLEASKALKPLLCEVRTKAKASPI